MRKTGKRRRMGTLRKRVSGRGGFTLAEMLAGMMVMLIASGVIAQTMAFAMRQVRERFDADDALKAYTNELVPEIQRELEYATDTNTISNYEYISNSEEENSLDISTEVTIFPNGNYIGYINVTVTIKNSDDTTVLQKTLTVIPIMRNIPMPTPTS